MAEPVPDRCARGLRAVYTPIERGIEKYGNFENYVTSEICCQADGLAGFNEKKVNLFVGLRLNFAKVWV